MGPTIILDKSAYQSLSRDDTFELSRYFYVVVPPVLNLEILADLKHPKRTAEEAQDMVMRIAKKVQPVDGYVNVDYRVICVNNLLGGKIEMDRRPIVAGARKVVTADGKKGIFLDNQPENEALIRWSCGRFAEAEELLATRWRAASEAIDLEAFKRELRSYGEWVPLESLSLVRQVADELMAAPEAQLSLIKGILGELRTLPEVREWTLHRWRNGGFRSVHDFARYAHHCVRVNIIFQLALVHQLIGTRSTNRIDMEYLYYSPFAHIFCSGDKLHRSLAEVVLADDQSFVWHENLRSALRQVANARASARESGRSDAHRLEPGEDSLIRTLWIKHLGHWPDKSRQGGTPRSKEDEKELRRMIDAMSEACDRAKRSSPPRPQWPCP